VMEEFFGVTSSPSNYDEIIDKLKEFINYQKRIDRKIAFVTSGGTTVPLEKNTVRYLDNFSGGGRGSASAEYFIEQGYAVIFLCRRHSLQPFSRQFLQTHSENSILEYLVKDPKTGSVEVLPQYNAKVAHLLDKHKSAVDNNQIFKINFVSIHEYLYWLRGICIQISSVGKNAIIYAAAAVSDYYIPASDMVEHKIQSSTGALTLKLEPVPKMLGHIKSHWAPDAFVVSFKLETDKALLEQKAMKSLSSYGHQLVVANLLQNYKDSVIIYSHSGPVETIQRNEEEKSKEVDIEYKLIQSIIRYHQTFYT